MSGAFKWFLMHLEYVKRKLSFTRGVTIKIGNENFKCKIHAVIILTWKIRTPVNKNWILGMRKTNFPVKFEINCRYYYLLPRTSFRKYNNIKRSRHGCSILISLLASTLHPKLANWKDINIKWRGARNIALISAYRIPEMDFGLKKPNCRYYYN